MVRALRKLWRSIRLLKRADAAFSMVSRGEDEAAFRHLAATQKMLGPFTQYTFGIEPMLLEIFLRGCLSGIKADDYDWEGLRDFVLSASEYNAAEKLHLILYLEELATTASRSRCRIWSVAPRQPSRSNDSCWTDSRSSPKRKEAVRLDYPELLKFVGPNPKGISLPIVWRSMPEPSPLPHRISTSRPLSWAASRIA